MRVLVGCEYSGIVRDAFIRAGHDAISCDLLSTESPGPHYQGDVFDIIDDGFDLAILHPPCTRLCNSGVRWLAERDLWDEMREGAEFFKRLLHSNIPMIAVENPVPHRYALEIIGKKYDQTIQPWQFGHTTSKRTCLWFRNLPPLSQQTSSQKSNIPTTFTLRLQERTERRSVVNSTRVLPRRWPLNGERFRLSTVLSTNNFNYSK